MQLASGEVIMSPSCPEVHAMIEGPDPRDGLGEYLGRLVREGGLLDMRPAVMSLEVVVEEFDDEGNPDPTVVAWVAFWGGGDEEPYLDVGRLRVRPGTRLADKLQPLASRKSDADTTVERLRVAVCGRVATCQCQAITEGDECGALGPAGFRAVIESVLGEQTGGP